MISDVDNTNCCGTISSLQSIDRGVYRLFRVGGQTRGPPSTDPAVCYLLQLSGCILYYMPSFALMLKGVSKDVESIKFIKHFVTKFNHPYIATPMGHQKPSGTCISNPVSYSIPGLQKHIRHKQKNISELVC